MRDGGCFRKLRVVSEPDRLSGHVFISYARHDAGHVDRLQRMLQAAGIQVWRDTADLRPGQDWRANIRRAITDDALVFIACFSQLSLGRSMSYQNEEILTAIELSRRRRPGDLWIIPVRFDECDVPDWDLGGGRTLTSLQRADLFGDLYQEECTRLIATILHAFSSRGQHSQPTIQAPGFFTAPPHPAQPAQGPSRLARTLDGHTGWVGSVAFSPIGTLLASTGEDMTVRLWQGAAATSVRTLVGHSEWGRCVAFSPDGALLASAGDDRTVRLWQAATGEAIRTLTGHTGPVMGVAFSPDGRLIASAGFDHTVRLWETGTCMPARMLTGHTEGVWAVTFSADGSLLASASDDHTVRVWQVATGKDVYTLTGHTAYTRRVAFSPDGSLLVSAGHDQTVRIWN